MIKVLSRFATEWSKQRALRQTELVLAGLPAELRRDIGFPAVDLFLDGSSRFRRR